MCRPAQRRIEYFATAADAAAGRDQKGAIQVRAVAPPGGASAAHAAVTDSGGRCFELRLRSGADAARLRELFGGGAAHNAMSGI